MGFIEKLRSRPAFGYAIAGGLFVIAAGVLVWANSGTIPANLQQAYYSTDDGKTFFADDINKAYPFDHDGKPAYRAYVYKNASGETSVAYLERYTQRGRARKLAMATQPVNDGGAEAAKLMAGETEVKKPGIDQWVPASSPMHALIMRPTDPTATGVYP